MAPALIAGFAQLAPLLIKYISGSDSAANATKIVADTAMAVAGVNTPQEALEKLQQDRELAYQFQLAISNKEAELDMAFLNDRQDARKRSVKLAEAGFDNRRADILAYGAAFTLFFLTVVLLFYPIPDGIGKDILLMLVGALIIVVKDIYAFEFGSTRSSKEKDTVIKNLTGN